MSARLSLLLFGQLVPGRGYLEHLVALVALFHLLREGAALLSVLSVL